MLSCYPPAQPGDTDHVAALLQAVPQMQTLDLSEVPCLPLSGKAILNAQRLCKNIPRIFEVHIDNRRGIVREVCLAKLNVVRATIPSENPRSLGISSGIVSNEEGFSRWLQDDGLYLHQVGATMAT